LSTYNDELAAIVAELNSSSPSSSRSAIPPPRSTSSSSFDQLLALAARSSASDVLLVAESGIAMRIQGELTSSTGPALTALDIQNLVLPLIDAAQQKRLQTEKTLDISFAREAIGRIRMNLHYQRGTLAAAIRLLPSQIPTLDSLHLPLSLGKLAEARHGLVLITGASGCVDRPHQRAASLPHCHD
jgi:twitching motility protein PilT